MKQILLAFSLQFVCGIAFSQEPPALTEPVKVEKTEEPIYGVVDEPAVFPGGNEGMTKYIKTNLHYPQSAKKEGIEGECYVEFVVSNSGYVSWVKIRKGITDCPECEMEAVRVVKNMPRWTPGKIAGKPVNSMFVLPIIFDLNN
ncbi:energy transducer TonB [Fluviicola sp.]|uniref:energy transducer TonB n=1 Tax=Fluviicola sp. TaxID=1917219 RepID=UPI0031E1ED0D